MGMHISELARVLYGKGWDVDGEPLRPVSYVPYSEFFNKRKDDDEFMRPLPARGNAKIMTSLKENLNMIYGTKSILEIINVIFNDPATIVFWSDGTKTVVKCLEGDVFDPEKGLAMAISKKAMGNKGSYYNVIDKWTEKYEGPSPLAVMLEKVYEKLRTKSQVRFEKPE